MFTATQKPFKPFSPPLGRKLAWYYLRPTAADYTYGNDQYFNCDDGPTTSDSFDKKYEGALAFFRAWFIEKKPRNLKNFSFRIKLTFNCDGELVPECLYPLIAMYQALTEAPEDSKPNIKRISVFLTQKHWFLWREMMADEKGQIELPLEAAANWGTLGCWLGLEPQEVWVAQEEALPSCQWFLPRVLHDVLTPYLSFLGVKACDSRTVWHGKSAAEMVEASAKLPPLPFRF